LERQLEYDSVENSDEKNCGELGRVKRLDSVLFWSADTSCPNCPIETIYGKIKPISGAFGKVSPRW
jgi:hypothetical protein